MSITRDLAVLSFVQDEILEKDEKIVWKGRPDARSNARADIVSPLFGFVVLVFGIAWSISPYGGIAFLAVCILIMIAGLWLLATPLRAYWRARTTYYAITSKRVLIVSARGRLKAKSIYGTDICAYRRFDKPRGAGSIQLTHAIRHTWTGPMETVGFADGLWGIEDVPLARARHRHLAQASNRPPPTPAVALRPSVPGGRPILRRGLKCATLRGGRFVARKDCFCHFSNLWR